MSTDSTIARIFKHCVRAVGEDNDDIKRYRNRPKIVTRDSFFNELVWAIWVSGKSRNAANTYLSSIEDAGLPVYDWRRLSSMPHSQRQRLLRQKHGLGKHQAYERWQSIFSVAENLADLADEKTFRQEYFTGKARSELLNRDDISKLTNRKIRWVGEANASFIIRKHGRRGDQVRSLD